MKHHLGTATRPFHAGEFALVIFGAFSWSAVVLHHGGWRWRDFHVHYSNAGTIVGIGLAVLAIASMVMVQAVMGGVRITPPSASLLAVLLVSVVNPWYEELFVCAYVIESLRGRFGLGTAINVSVALRVSYHLYQGPPAFATFAIFGLR